ncbi:MAG: hypothetical protein KGY39_02645 [Anaerolineales bacterium]|nr:hypothetical protein [Anaerolineales bacterium]MBS3752759.1 hypothetical protein [Anaerolineales bacterium]
MFTREDLESLLDYRPQAPVLSVYLNTNPAERTADDYKLQLRSLLKDIDMADDVEAVREYFEYEYDWTGHRSAVVFSCVQKDFFQSIPLAVDVRNQAYVQDQPYIKPLASLFDSFSGYGVILVDQQKARFFSFHLGDLEGEEEFSGQDVQRQKHGGGSQTTGRRSGDAGDAEYADTVSDRNLREASKHANKFLKKHDVRRVLIGGTEKNISSFREYLTKSWQSLIVGTFPMEMSASYSEVQKRALKIGKEAEEKRKQKLIETVITEAAKGRNGLLRFDEILSAVREGRVQTLLVQEGFIQPGYQCDGCGYITTQELGSCPFCSDTFQRIDDAVEMVVREVLQAGGSVEVLDSNEALESHGGIGALLRY